MPKDFRKFVMRVVDVKRSVRQCGGKMRPREKPIWICRLVCGHTIEKIKSARLNPKPPEWAKCSECMEQVD